MARFAVNCSILFTERPLLERPGAAKDAGFDAIELWWPFSLAVPPAREVDALVSSVRDAGVQLVALNLFAGDMPGGDRGVVSWVGRSGEFRDNVEVVAEIGRILGCRAFNALYGNRLDDVSEREQDELAVENLAFAADAIAAIDGIVLLEPLSGAQRYPVRTADDGAAILDRVGEQTGRENLGLLLDVYHLAVNGDDVHAAIGHHHHRTAHVQLADAPGRGEPGSGVLDIGGYLDALGRTGYDGFVALEYVPTTSTAASLEWLPRERRGLPEASPRPGT